MDQEINSFGNEVKTVRISNEQAQQIMAAQKLKGAKGASGAAEVGKASEATAVSMSSMGQELGKALGVLGSMPDVRADRVAELKAQIASGDYQVSGRDVAESLLRRAADQLI
jgi:negative regulator of flagellin synthesis FlgM